MISIGLLGVLSSILVRKLGDMMPWIRGRKGGGMISTKSARGAISIRQLNISVGARGGAMEVL
jgi:hypothetical protein